MRFTTVNLLASSCLAVLLASQLRHAEAAATSIWVFGDEYVDTGTSAFNKYIRRKCNFAPYGQDLQLANGRCSNGMVITDRLAVEMKLEVPGPFSGPAEYHKNGVSFAAPGAGALITTNLGATVGLDRQLLQFRAYVRAKKITSLKNSIVLVSFGMNDYLHAISQRKNPMTYIDKVVPKIAALIAVIQKLTGAYRFVVLSVPPLGCIPYIREVFNAPAGGCITNVNAVSKYHDARLAFYLKVLSARKPNKVPLYYSMFSITDSMTDKKSGFQAFTKTWNVACGVKTKQKLFNCGQLVAVFVGKKKKMIKIWAAPIKGYDYWWWDWLNPTQDAHYMMWVNMWEGTHAQPYGVSTLNSL